MKNRERSIEAEDEAKEEEEEEEEEKDKEEAREEIPSGQNCVCSNSKRSVTSIPGNTIIPLMALLTSFFSLSLLGLRGEVSRKTTSISSS